MPISGLPHTLPPMWPTPMPSYACIPLPAGMPLGCPYQSTMMPQLFYHGMQWPPYQQQMPINPYPAYLPIQPRMHDCPHPVPWS